MSAEVATTPAAAAAPGPSAAAAAAAKEAGLVKGTSLYVGDLVPDASEPVLFEHFSSVAPVASVRVCRNALTRESLGYAYVNFQSAADAEKAMNELAYSLIKGRPCRIMWAQRDPSVRRSNVGNIFIKNLAPEITSRELNETFKLFGSILSCKVATTPKGDSKGYAFVHYETEESAKAAIAEVNGMEFGGRKVEVLPYVAKSQRSGPEWTNIYVKNVPKAWTETTLKEVFGAHGEILSAVVTKDAESGASKGFGFVCFKDHVAASSAVDALNGKEVDGEPASQPPKKPAAGEAPKPEEAAKPDAPAGKVRLWVGRAQKKSERERALREKTEAAKRERLSKMQGCNLFVRNLDESVDDAKLKEVFAPFGTITSAVVARESDGRSKLHGFVCFSTSEEAGKALAGQHHKLVQGKPLWVALWQSKEQRAATMAEQERRRAGTAAGAGRAGPGASTANAMGAGPGANPAAMAGNMAAMAQQMGNPMMMMSLMQQLILSQAAAAQAGGAANPAAMQQMQQFQALVQLMMQQQAMGRNAMAAQQQQMGRGGAPNAAAIAAGGRAGMAAGPGGVNPAMAALAMFGANPALQQQAALMGQQQAAAAAQQAQMAAANGAPGSRNGRRTAPGGPTSPTSAAAVAAGVPASQQQMGGARIAAGPAARGPAVPVTGPQRGPGPVSGGYDSARPGAPANAPATAMLPGARNQPAASAAGPSAAPSAPVTGAADFAAQLAAASPEARKNMIGERLYGLISRSQPEKAGKITGMLLDGMDDGELLHLLESASDLSARVKEALDVLRLHEEAMKAEGK